VLAADVRERTTGLGLRGVQVDQVLRDHQSGEGRGARGAVDLRATQRPLLVHVAFQPHDRTAVVEGAGGDVGEEVDALGVGVAVVGPLLVHLDALFALLAVAGTLAGRADLGLQAVDRLVVAQLGLVLVDLGAQHLDVGVDLAALLQLLGLALGVDRVGAAQFVERSGQRVARLDLRVQRILGALDQLFESHDQDRPFVTMRDGWVSGQHSHRRASARRTE